MQPYTFIAATALPFATLGNPGAIYVQDNPTQRSTIVAEVKEVPFPKYANSRATIAIDQTNDSRGAIKFASNGNGRPGGAVVALSRLRTFSTWTANWDGDGAPAPNGEALDSAALMLGFLHSKLGRTPNVVLNGNGEPTFTMIDGEFELSVTIVSSKEAAYFVAFGPKELAGLTEFDGRALPPELASAVSELRPQVV